VTDISNAPVRMGAAAVQLRVNGTSYEDIAMTLGLSSPRAALTLVSRELAQQGEGMEEERDELRRVEAARLDELLVSVMAKATDPECSEHLPAVRTAVTIIDRRIKLYGLDAPTEITVHTPTATELDNWVASMVAHSMPPQAALEPDIMGDDIIEGEVIDD
jgi:hypothetical protein